VLARRAQSADRNFTIRYGSGVVDGVVVYDTLELGLPLTNVSNQGVGMATNSTADFASTSCDGIFVRPLRTAGGPCRAHQPPQADYWMAALVAACAVVNRARASGCRLPARQLPEQLLRAGGVCLRLLSE
jgi:hypothetical protein